MIDVEAIAFITDENNSMVAGCKRARDIWQLIDNIVDEINLQVAEHYRVRIVHEDGTDFVEVLKIADVQYRPEGLSEKGEDDVKEV